MLRVSNRSCIRDLAHKSFKASKSRNIVAVLAIALTAILFTSLFTIAMSMNTAFQESNFRQAGGYSHGSFKYITEQQYNELQDDPLIKAHSARRVVGLAANDVFIKNQVEVSWCDQNDAHWMYLDPIEGRLPQEGTNEAATDLEILKLLGVEPKLGAEFSITVDVDGRKTTQNFTLCGWWDKDPIVVANHILIPQSRVDAIIQEVGGILPTTSNLIGTWNMNVMLRNASHIEENLITILHNHGYQTDDSSQKDTYISIGVNWGYTGAQLSQSIDPAMLLTIIALLLLIIFTGYLIIYNVFQISVINDIRFYGLLKTIGTTGRQIKSLLRRQALMLCMIGIPIGLIGGWLIGAKLTPVILSRLNDLPTDVLSINPLIFVGSSLFALFTVLLSCARPGKIAAKVSPIEAVRYTEGNTARKATRKGSKRFSLLDMAWANLGRNKAKSFITILSLTLAVVLLQITTLFTSGFDMDKYLAHNSVSDFIVADARHFQSNPQSSSLEPYVIGSIQAQGGIKNGGYVYKEQNAVQEFITEDYYRKSNERWYTPEEISIALQDAVRNTQGLVMKSAQTYGMEPYALDKLRVVEGDLSQLYKPGSRAIAAVYHEGDYGEVLPDSHWAKLGDTVTLRYVEKWEYIDSETGEIYETAEQAGNRPYHIRPVIYRDVDFTVTALVTVPYALSYRYFGTDEFVMNAETFKEVSGTDNIMLYAFDTTDEGTADMEAFLHDFTSNIAPSYDYESKATYQAEFESFRSMFLILGSVLSFIIGLIGILNFCNAILTGIITRKREFATLQAIGMSGKQLKSMLIYEGLCYAICSILFALVLSLALSPAAASVLSGMFWFFSYRPTFVPIVIIAPLFILLGCIVPLIVYHTIAKLTIVERLHESES